MIYDDLHNELLKAINEARESNLPHVVVAIQNAIGCISSLQRDSEDLELIRKTLGVKWDYKYIRPMKAPCR